MYYFVWCLCFITGTMNLWVFMTTLILRNTTTEINVAKEQNIDGSAFPDLNRQISLETRSLEEWKQYKTAFDKYYDNEEDHKRMKIFLENSKFIEDHNRLYTKGLSTFELGHNAFSDLTHEEFLEQYTTLDKPTHNSETNCEPTVRYDPTVHGHLDEPKGHHNRIADDQSDLKDLSKKIYKRSLIDDEYINNMSSDLEEKCTTSWLYCKLKRILIALKSERSTKLKDRYDTASRIQYQVRMRYNKIRHYGDEPTVRYAPSRRYKVKPAIPSEPKVLSEPTVRNEPAYVNEPTVRYAHAGSYKVKPAIHSESKVLNEPTVRNEPAYLNEPTVRYAPARTYKVKPPVPGEPNVLSEPTVPNEPAYVNEPTVRYANAGSYKVKPAIPSASKVLNVPTVRNEPAYLNEPTVRYARAGSYKVKPAIHSESKVLNEPTVRNEPAYLNEPTVRYAPARSYKVKPPVPGEPNVLSEPTVRNEPAYVNEPTVRYAHAGSYKVKPAISSEPKVLSEPTVRNEPAYLNEPTVRYAPARSYKVKPPVPGEPNVLSEPTDDPAYLNDPTVRYENEPYSAAKRNFAAFSNAYLPAFVDWRRVGAVTPVKDQGNNCKASWLFSATGSLEGQIFRKTHKLTSLSEQNILDCSNYYGNSGCSNGTVYNSLEYILKNEGINTNTTYPWNGWQSWFCHYTQYPTNPKIRDIVHINSESEYSLRDAVAGIGPISVSIDASSRKFQFYTSGIYNERNCSTTNLNYHMLVVGYGMNHWIVKNSMGTKWGLNGYIFMSKGRGNQCGIASRAMYPLV